MILSDFTIAKTDTINGNRLGKLMKLYETNVYYDLLMIDNKDSKQQEPTSCDIC